MVNETVIPQLRFPEFIGNWEVKEFGDLYDFKFTNSFSRDNLNYENGIVKNIHYGDIHTKFNSQFDITKELVPYVNEDIDISRINDENYLIEGDLVIADASEDYADIGKSIEIVNLNNEKTLAGLHTILARRKSDDIAIGFASFILKTNSVRLEVMKVAQGSKVLSISTGRLAKIGLTLPKPEEQTKIANFITKVDNQIQLLEKEKTLLEKYKKGISQKIFNQEIRFKDDNGNDFPDWEEKKLANSATFFSGGTPLTTKKEFYNGEIPFIKSGEINNIKTDQYISEDGLKISSAKMVEIGDLLYALYGATSGEVAISKINGAINQAVLCIRNNSFNNRYLLNYLQFNKIAIIEKYIQGGQGNLSADIVKKLVIPTPSIDEQNKIADFLSHLDNLIEKTNIQISKSKSFKKGLLQKMFV